jgi:CheY-like chemotaxis protein
VLVVDDDAGIRSIVAELLEDEGYTLGTRPKR